MNDFCLGALVVIAILSALAYLGEREKRKYPLPDARRDDEPQWWFE